MAAHPFFQKDEFGPMISVPRISSTPAPGNTRFRVQLELRVARGGLPYVLPVVKSQTRSQRSHFHQ